MDKNSKAYQSGEYDDFFKAAELNNLVSEDFVAYSQSYAKMEETERAMEYAVAESYTKGETDGFAKGETAGFAKGESVSLRKTAVKLKQMGFSPSEISEATGLSVDEINKL